MVELSKEKYLDKCRGAWAGQMIGVCFGAPYEFRFNGRPVMEKLREWSPDLVRTAINQDDCYVEMTFLMSIEKYGIDITSQQAGLDFGQSEYKLWHANRYARANIRHGILPPKSGYPEYNRHADDIDFQIEADLFGIICPGLPQESNRFCDVFGHIMNYGDGVYGGMFVAGMYSAAFFEDDNVRFVLEKGLACIPAESLYHKCISDVIRWYNENPNDWLKTWQLVEDKWQDDVDCLPGIPFNIDARLNGAYIAMALLYGDGDPYKTMEIGTRCGQDADCNPSNALGVLGCMKGYRGLGRKLTGGIAGIADEKFSYTNYSFNTLIPACRKTAEKMILRAGGRVMENHYAIPVQEPEPPRTLEQWTDQMRILSIAIPQSVVNLWNPAWRVVSCGHYLEPGLEERHQGRDNVLMVHPVSPSEPAVLEASLPVTQLDRRLRIDSSSHTRGDFLLKVFLDGKLAYEELIGNAGKWTSRDVDLPDNMSDKVNVRIEVHANDWNHEAAYFDRIAVVP